MKKVLSLILAAVMLLALLAGCGSSAAKTEEKTETTPSSSSEAAKQQVTQEVKDSATITETQSIVASDEATTTPQGSAYFDAELAKARGELDQELVVGINADWKDISPWGGDNGGKWWVSQPINIFLANSEVFAATFEDYKPAAAKRMEKIDATTYEFELWDCIEDGEGNHITSADAKFSLDSIAQAKDFQRIGTLIKEVQIVDDYTFRIVLKQEELGGIEYILLKAPIVSQKWFESSDDATRATYPVGCGPYYVSDISAGSYVELTRKDNFWQKDEDAKTFMMQAPYSKITIKLIKDNSVRTVAYENGEIDMIKNLNVADINRFLNEDGTAKPGYTVTQCYDSRMQVLGFNCAKGTLFDNEDLRKAVLYAFDTDELLLAFGLDERSGRVSHDITSQCCNDYVAYWDAPEYDYYNRDVAKAKEYLKKAGYKEGELTVKLLCKNSLAGYEPMATYFQAQLAEVGINVEIMILEQAITDDMLLQPDGWDLAFEGINACNTTAEGYAYMFDNRNWLNGTCKYNIVDDELQSMVEVITDPAHHTTEAIEEIHDYVMDKAYVVGLFGTAYFYAGPDTFTGIVTNSEGNPCINGCNVTADYVSTGVKFK